MCKLQVPPERMECLFNTFAYDHRADGMVVSRPYLRLFAGCAYTSLSLYCFRFFLKTLYELFWNLRVFIMP